MEDYRSTLLVILAGVQLLLVPAYRSTDFEVHRNWLAITHSLPISKWYYEATSEWTLDYPPLFAWFERVMAPLAALADPKMLSVSNLEYDSPATILFQRLSVMATGLLLPAAAWRAARICAGGAASLRGQLLFFLLVANAGLLLVDNLHFQYNGILMGLMVWSLLLAAEGRFVASGVLFAVLLNMKHLFAYMAPVYFVSLLRNYCLGGAAAAGGAGAGAGGAEGAGGAGGGGGFAGAEFAKRLALLGGAVAAVFGASLGPFVAMGQLPQLLSRLFPFGRGLTHAYWAPNAWALYSFADKLLAAGLSRAGVIAAPAVGHMAGGVVGTAKFAVLPQVGPKAAAAAVLLSLLPCLAALWRRPSARALAAAVAYANLCGFVWGYHVHEKAIITVTVPLALLAVESADWARDFLLLATAGHAALFPLFFGWAEAPVKWLVVGLYAAVAAVGLARLHGGGGGGGARKGGGGGAPAEPAARGGGGSGGGSGSSGGWLPRWCKLYMWGLIPLELYCSLGHTALLGGRLPFVPLLLTSVYCAAAPVGVWARTAAWYACGCPERR